MGYWRGFAGWIRALDTGGLKRLGVFTYFGVYAFLFVVHRLVNRLVFALPAGVRPPPVAPVWEVLALPQSVAMALFSLAVTALVLTAVMARDALDRLDAADESGDRLPSVGLPSPKALLPGELGQLDALSSGEPVSTDGSGDRQHERSGEDAPARTEATAPAGELNLADAEAKVDDEEWPGEWMGGDEL